MGAQKETRMNQGTAYYSTVRASLAHPRPPPAHRARVAVQQCTSRQTMSHPMTLTLPVSPSPLFLGVEG